MNDLFRFLILGWFPLAILLLPPLQAGITPPESINFDQLRAAKLRPVDSKVSLELLARTLATTDNAGTQTALLKGMLAGLEGRRNVPGPENWGAAKSHLSISDNPEVRQLTQRLSQIFGDKEANRQALVTVRDNSAPADQRRSALRSLLTQNSPELKQILPALLDDPALRVDAIRAYGSIDDPNSPTLLLSRYSKMDFQSQRAIIETLATRKNYATALLAAIEDTRVPKTDIPAYIARNLSSLLGGKFTAVYGDVGELSRDKADLISKYKKLLTSDRMSEADSTRGRLVFQTSCLACHSLYGTGGVIGPDLTGSNRADLDYILLNMIDPSADIPDAYKLITIKTRSGQVLTGTLSDEDDQRVILNMIGQTLTVVKSDIATRETSPYSMMPEGLLPTLKDEQVLDLVKYLQTTTQVDLPE